MCCQRLKFCFVGGCAVALRWICQRIAEKVAGFTVSQCFGTVNGIEHKTVSLSFHSLPRALLLFYFQVLVVLLTTTTTTTFSFLFSCSKFTAGVVDLEQANASLCQIVFCRFHLCDARHCVSLLRIQSGFSLSFSSSSHYGYHRWFSLHLSRVLPQGLPVQTKRESRDRLLTQSGRICQQLAI